MLTIVMVADDILVCIVHLTLYLSNFVSTRGAIASFHSSPEPSQRKKTQAPGFFHFFSHSLLLQIQLEFALSFSVLTFLVIIKFETFLFPTHSFDLAHLLEPFHMNVCMYVCILPTKLA